MDHAQTTLQAIEKTWVNMYPELMYQFDFLDNQIAAFYQTEQKMLTITQAFAGIAFFIGCMGLYGLVSFIAVQKTKEIGIRKVLGGKISQILWIFGKEFSLLTLISFLIAAPLGWFLMNRWLSTYEYRIELGLWIFLSELFIVAGVVLITVSYRSIKAAMANPVNCLRTE
jgi:ABC-type antimicrobial peptide transport system permease subunit